VLRHRFRSLFYSQKQSPGTVKKPCGSNLGNIVGTFLGSSTDLIVGTVIGTLISSPTEYLVRLQNAVISGFPAHAKWFQKEETTAWNRCRNRDGNGSGNRIGNHDRNHEDYQIGNRVGVGGRRGKERETEMVPRGFPGWKVRK